MFDRRGHAVYAVSPPYDTARLLVQIGAEPGRLLSPSAFDLGEDGRFVVADTPNRRGRIQLFLAGGARVGGFTLSTRDTPTMVVDTWLQSGLVSLGFTGQSVIISQPELGSLISEYRSMAASRGPSGRCVQPVRKRIETSISHSTRACR